MRTDNLPPGKSRRLEQRSAALKGEGRTCLLDGLTRDEEYLLPMMAAAIRPSGKCRRGD
jgi:hypothetical protein